MEKKELIKSYLLEEGVSEEERKRRFEIAWDIWQNFDDILFELKQDFLETFVRKVKKSKEFRDYEVVDFGLINGEKRPMCIFKRSWIFEDYNEYGIFNYVIGSAQKKIYYLFYGIMKYDENKPFKGNWKRATVRKEIDSDLVTVLNRIYNKLGGKEYRWEVDSYYIAWRWLDLFDKNDFDSNIYLLHERNMNWTDILFDELVELKNSTEELIDEFVEIYKNKIE